MSDSASIGVRLQQMSTTEQVLVLARLVESRVEDGFAPSDIGAAFYELTLPPPAKVSNALGALEKQGAVVRRAGRGYWRLTPLGRERSLSLLGDLDVAAMLAEAANSTTVALGHASHPTLPPTWAPAEVVVGLRAFLDQFPFERNVFGMTRFPDEADDDGLSDPVAGALEQARTACGDHGLVFHLASDRMIVDDLWANVLAHMWGSQYGIALFEDRRGRGVNYNLTIEVGGMLLSGRRTALLRDVTIERLPTDLVGKIYKTVDLDDASSVANAVHAWLRDDLRLGACDACPGSAGVGR